MNNDEAKFILRAYRPGGRDAGDPAFAAGLEQARRDPALGAWFAREQAHDAAIAGKLREVMPPAGLREAILAGGKVSARARGPWLRPAWLAAAAAVVVMLGVVALWPANRAEAAPQALAEFALDDMKHRDHGSHGEASAELQRWLVADNKLAGPMPVDFDKLRQTGCRTLNFNGREMVEICFVRNGAVFHLYVSRKTPADEAKNGPFLMDQTGGAAAVWTDEHYRYALVSPGDVASLKKVILG